MVLISIKWWYKRNVRLLQGIFLQMTLLWTPLDISICTTFCWCHPMDIHSRGVPLHKNANQISAPNFARLGENMPFGGRTTVLGVSLAARWCNLAKFGAEILFAFLCRGGPLEWISVGWHQQKVVQIDIWRGVHKTVSWSNIHGMTLTFLNAQW